MTGIRKGKHPVRIIRIIAAAAVFILFLMVLISGTMIFAPLRNVLVSLQLFPAFINSVLSGTAVLILSWGGILLLTLLFGRFYCSVLCPLGILQDIFIFLSRRPGKKAFRYGKEKVWIRFPVFLAALTAAFFGSFILIDLLEPYSFFGRIIHDIGRPLTALGSLGINRILRKFEIFTSPWIHPLNVPLLFLTAGMLTAVGIASVKRGRWFCNTLCPTGTVLSIPSRFSHFRIRLKEDSCIQCGKCEGVCRAGCIDSETKRVDNGNCVACFDCLGICPTGALGYSGNIIPAPKKDPPSPDGISRRDFLRRMGRGSAAGAALSSFPVSFLLKKRTAAWDGTPVAPASPPGSGGIVRFTGRCTACHLCVSRCPTQVLQPSLSEYGLEGMFQPVMDYSNGFCDYQCNICSQVCPTGAIKPVTLGKKREIQIGEVRFIRDRCVVFSEETACGACAEMCPTHAVHMIPYRGHLTQPETDVTLCIGCGNCEYACPVEGKKAIYVEGKKTHSLRRVPEREKPVRKEEPAEEPETDTGEDSKKGFPF